MKQDGRDWRQAHILWKMQEPGRFSGQAADSPDGGLLQKLVMILRIIFSGSMTQSPAV